MYNQNLYIYSQCSQDSGKLFFVAKRSSAPNPLVVVDAAKSYQTDQEAARFNEQHKIHRKAGKGVFLEQQAASPELPAFRKASTAVRTTHHRTFARTNGRVAAV